MDKPVIVNDLKEAFADILRITQQQLRLLGKPNASNVVIKTYSLLSTAGIAIACKQIHDILSMLPIEDDTDLSRDTSRFDVSPVHSPIPVKRKIPFCTVYGDRNSACLRNPHKP